MHLLSECVMLDKISPAKFRFIYHEMIGDNSKADTQKQAEYDEHIWGIIKHADHALCQEQKQKKFYSFWDIPKNVIQELTAVNDRHRTKGSTTSGDVL